VHQARHSDQPVTCITLPLLSFLGILIKPFAYFLPDPSSVDHADQQPARSILAVTRLVVQDSLDRQASVQTNQISESQRAHGMTHAQAECRVNVFGRSSALVMSTSVEEEDHEEMCEQGRE
jgi:hypothetical protein